MSLKFTYAKAAAALDTLLAGINDNGVSNAAGYVCIYSGSIPADMTVSPTGTLLAQCALIDGSVAAFAGASVAATPVAVGYVSGGKFAEDASANASGVAGYFRLYDWNNVARCQGTIGTIAADMIVDSLNVTATYPFTITECNPSISGLT